MHVLRNQCSTTQYHIIVSRRLLYRVDKPDFVFYKCSFNICFKVTRISKRTKTRTHVNDSHIETDPIIQFARCEYNKIELSEKKCKELKSMFKYTPEIDVAYYKTLI